MEKDSLYRKYGTAFVASLLLLGLYYMSYRYPLKFNDSTTSPTYSDTPGIISVLKYAIFAAEIYLLILVILANKLQMKMNKNYLFELVSTMLIITLSFVSFLITKDQNLVQTGLFFIAFLICLLIGFNDFKNEKIYNIFKFFVYVSIFVNMYQVFMFYFKGRLPALAYEGSISVRFGYVLG